jgi:hypothetical protein
MMDTIRITRNCCDRMSLHLSHGIKAVVMTQTDQNVFFVKDAGYKSRIASYPT